MVGGDRDILSLSRARALSLALALSRALSLARSLSRALSPPPLARCFSLSLSALAGGNHANCSAALEATQGQNDSFFSELPYKCHLEEVASVGY